MSLFFIIFSFAFAQNCPDKGEDLGNFRYRQRQISASFGCLVEVNPVSDSKPIRGYNFFKNGQIQIRTKIGTDQGTRNYFILPANETTELKKLGGLGVQIKDSAGLGWTFNEQGQIKSENGCKIKVAPAKNWETENTSNNKDGGFLIQSCPGSIVVDIGFRKTLDPVLDKDGLASVRDSFGKSCQFKKSELFNYTKYEGIFKFKRSQDLYTFLANKKECQGLDLSPLNTSGKSGTKGNQP